MVAPAADERAHGAAALTIPIDIRITRLGPRRRTCPWCHRRRVVFAIAVRADPLSAPALDAGTTTPRCAECWGIRA